MSVTPRVGLSEIVGSGTSPTLAEPALAKNGDVLYAFAICDVAGAVTPPTGWTTLYKGLSTSVAWNIAWVRRGETAPNLTWGLTGSVYREVYVVCLTANGGLITLHSQSAAGPVGNATTTTHTPDPPSTIVTAPSALALCCAFHFAGSATTVWGCAGYTAQTQNALTDDGCVFAKSLVTAGIEDPPAWTTTGAGTLADYWDGATVTFTDVQVPQPSYGSSPAVIQKRVAKQQRMP